MSAPLQPFSPATPLAPGITLVEASAGTGKTWNIANLVVRLVAGQGLELAEILVVTYTKAAAAELRDRIRVRLGEAAESLAQGVPVDAANPVLADLCQGPAEVRRQRLDRLRRALVDFDEAAISTIHGFCQRVLQRHAFESGAGFDLELATDAEPLLEEVVDDFLAAELHDTAPDDCRFLVETAGLQRGRLLGLARKVTAVPELRTVPEAHAGERWADALAAFRAAWLRGRDDLARAVDATPVQKRTTYKPANTAAACTWIDGWLAGPALPPLADLCGKTKSHAVRYFSPAQLAEHTTDPGAPIFRHPLLQAFAGLMDLARDAVAAPRVRFAHHVRAQLAERKTSRGLQTYDDLLQAVARGLQPRPEQPGPTSLCRAIRSRFRAALIDEFQDTDPVQWRIFGTVFGTGEHCLYLIGDPKQAIYAFRGADVVVYLQAREAAPAARRFTMQVNQRSDGRLVAACNRLLGAPAMFHDPGIDYVEVQAAARHEADRLVLGPGPQWAADVAPELRAPLQIRHFDATLRRGGERAPIDTAPIDTAPIDKGTACRLLPRAVADDIVAFLREAWSIRDPKSGTWRRVRPADIAVLVRKNAQARQIREALLARGVLAVVASTGSVFDSDEARSLERWLQAMAEPHREGLARALAVDPLFGHDAAWLARASSEDDARTWTRWMDQLAAWSRRLARQGFVPTWRQVLAHRADPAPDDAAAADPTAQVPGPTLEERLVARPDGERRLTNLRHLAELLHEEAVASRLGAAGLLAWLREQRRAKVADGDAAEMRLESDADAVRIVTMHKSKGLQYPVVWLPYLWEGRLLGQDDKQNLRVHDEAGDVLFDLGPDPSAPPKRDHVARAEDEARQENLRLLYVALTRAEHRCFVYSGCVNGYGDSPLAYVLHGAAPGEPPPDAAGRLARAKQVAGNPQILEQDLAALALPADGRDPDVAWRKLAPTADRTRWRPEGVVAPLLSTRLFERPGLDLVWRRSSFTALTRGLDGTVLTLPVPDLPEVAALAPTDLDAQIRRSETGDEEATSEAPADGLADVAAPTPDAADVPLAAFPSGAAAGDFLHQVLERLDFLPFAQGEPGTGRDAGLDAVLDDLLPRHGFGEPPWRPALTDGLAAALVTPLGTPVADLRLCDLGRGDRLDELRFDFPLAGGDTWRPGAPVVTSAALVRCLQGRGGDARMRRAYLESLGGGADGRGGLDFDALAGFMTGSIDLVFRADVGGRPQWFLADYKSNRIDPERTGRLPADRYAPAALRALMEEKHYYLQYHIYLVALHRFLATRLPGYDYDRDVGGALYLFVRGLVGPATRREEGLPYGVFFDKPPRAVIEGLSDLFEHGPGCARVPAPGEWAGRSA